MNAKQELIKIIRIHKPMTEERLKLIQFFIDTYGIKEIKGKLHNSKIVNFFMQVGASWFSSDETAWCGAYAGSGLIESKGKNPLGYRAVVAADWLKLKGKSISLIQAQVGDYIVVKRNGGSGYHITHFFEMKDGIVYCMGGNQGNTAKVSGYDPTMVERVIDFDSV